MDQGSDHLEQQNNNGSISTSSAQDLHQEAIHQGRHDGSNQQEDMPADGGLNGDLHGLPHFSGLVQGIPSIDHDYHFNSSLHAAHLVGDDTPRKIKKPKKEDRELSQKRKKQKEEKRVVKAFMKAITEPVPEGVEDVDWKRTAAITGIGARPLDKVLIYTLFEKHIQMKDIASSVFWKYVLNSVYTNKRIFKTTRPNGVRCLTGVQFRTNLTTDEKQREEIKPHLEKLERYLIYGGDALLTEVDQIGKMLPEKPKHGNTGKKKRKRDGLLGDNDDDDDDDKKEDKKGHKMLSSSSDSIGNSGLTSPAMDETMIEQHNTGSLSLIEALQLLASPSILRTLKTLAYCGDEKDEKYYGGMNSEDAASMEKFMQVHLMQQQHTMQAGNQLDENVQVAGSQHLLQPINDVNDPLMAQHLQEQQAREQAHADSHQTTASGEIPAQ